MYNFATNIVTNKRIVISCSLSLAFIYRISIIEKTKRGHSIVPGIKPVFYKLAKDTQLNFKHQKYTEHILISTPFCYKLF